MESRRASSASGDPTKQGENYMTLVTAEVEDVGTTPDDSVWLFSSTLRESGDGSKIITPKWVRHKPIAGLVSIDLDPGFSLVSYRGKEYVIEVPDSGPADLWDLISASVAFPAGTSPELVAQAVMGYLAAHPLSKSDVGLGSVDNTPDASKPVSTAQLAALNAKQDKHVGALATWTKIGDEQARPTNPAIVVIGDSFSEFNTQATAWNGSPGSRTASSYATGFLVAAMAWNRQPANWYEVGVGGTTAAQGLARFDTDVTPLKPKVVIVEFGSNDMAGNRTATAVFADLLAMWRKAWSFGAKVIATSCPPRDGYTDTQEQEANKLNAMLRNFAATNPADFALVDWFPTLVDPTTGNYKTAFTSDGTHLTTAGSWAAAKLFESALDRFLPAAPPPLAVSNVNDADNLLTNPFFIGSAGTVTASKGLTGTAPTGWTVNAGGTNGTQASALSQVARSDGYGSWQQIKTTLIPSGGYVSLAQYPSGWAAGDIVQACVEFETDDDWAGGTNTPIECQIYVSGPSGTLHVANSFVGYWSTRAESGVLLSPAIVIPATTTAVGVQMVTGGLGTVRYALPSLRKLAVAP